MRGGKTIEALEDLTGCPCLQYNLSNEYVREMIKNGFLWRKMKEFDERGFLLSGSTDEPDDKWADLGDQSEDQSLLKGHAYTILVVTEVRGHRLLKLRNIWGTLDWHGEWNHSSTLWTNEIRREIIGNQHEDQETSVWLSFEEFQNNFEYLNVCKIQNWQELRIKGKYVRIQDIDNPNVEIVMSKWYYAVEVQESTELIITLHQEDERISGVYSRRPNLDIGIAILKRNESSVELLDLQDFVIERQCSLEIVLDPGSYIILPRSTGCTLRRPSDAKPESIKLIDSHNHLTPLMKSTVQDIFRKLDMLLNRELTYNEFKGFYECLNRHLSEEEFKTEILPKYCSSLRGITERGLEDFFVDSILESGEEIVWEWLENLGYDKDLYSIRSRCFMLTMHSDNEVTVNVKDAIQTDLDNKTNALIIERYGQESEVKRGVKALYTFSEYIYIYIYIYYIHRQVHVYSYGILNEHTKPIEAVIDCSASESMLFSTKTPIVKKVIYIYIIPHRE